MKSIAALAVLPALFQAASAVPGTLPYLNLNTALPTPTGGYSDPAVLQLPEEFGTDAGEYVTSLLNEPAWTSYTKILESVAPGVDAATANYAHGTPAWWTKLPNAQQSYVNSMNRALVSIYASDLDALEGITSPGATKTAASATATTTASETGSAREEVKSTSTTGAAVLATPAVQVALAALAGGAALVLPF